MNTAAAEKRGLHRNDSDHHRGDDQTVDKCQTVSMEIAYVDQTGGCVGDDCDADQLFDESLFGFRQQNYAGTTLTLSTHRIQNIEQYYVWKRTATAVESHGFV